MFAGFTDEGVDVGEAVIRVRHRAGSGPPVVLLHGHPRTSATWHRVAPRLVEAGRRVTCPLLVLWSRFDDLEDLYGDPLTVWETWADDVRGRGLDSGHHMAEEAPDELAAALVAFFAGSPVARA